MFASVVFFFFNDTATTEIYTLSLHDALPIYVEFVGVYEPNQEARARAERQSAYEGVRWLRSEEELLGDSSITAVDRKSTRLNSSHANISYAVFCLKKKKKRL